MQEDIPITRLKSETFTLEAVIKINCSALPVFKTAWSFYMGPFLNDTVKITGQDLDTPYLTFSNTMDYNMYKVCVVIEMLIDSSFKTSKCGFLSIIAGPLKAVLSGGSFVLKSRESDVSNKIS